MVTQGLGSGIRRAGVLQGRRLNTSDHRLILVEMELQTVLKVWGDLRLPAVPRAKQTKRLRLSDEQIVTAYQIQVAKEWDERGMAQRTAELEEMGQKWLQGEEAAVDSTALALRPGRSWSAAVGPWAPPKTAIPAPCPMGGRLRGQCRRMWGMGRWRIA